MRLVPALSGGLLFWVAQEAPREHDRTRTKVEIKIQAWRSGCVDEFTEACREVL